MHANCATVTGEQTTLLQKIPNPKFQKKNDHIIIYGMIIYITLLVYDGL